MQQHCTNQVVHTITHRKTYAKQGKPLGTLEGASTLEVCKSLLNSKPTKLNRDVSQIDPKTSPIVSKH